jgi:hypothetical protein
MAGSAGVVERIGTSKEGRHSLEEEEGETGGMTIEGDGGDDARYVTDGRGK